MLRVLTLSTLFPDASRPGFGRFVARQTQALAARDGVEVRVVAPVGLPMWPLAGRGRFAALAALPLQEEWAGLRVARPRFTTVPGTGGRFHAGALRRALLPMLADLRRGWRFDIIDAEFFFPDGVAAVALGHALDVPVSVKARGSDVHHWGRAPATHRQIARAGRQADGLLAVSDALAGEVAALTGRGDVVVHRTGVNQALFRPDKAGVLKAALGVTGPLVISAGTLNANKGHHLMIDAVASLRDVTLLIAGDGPDRAALAAQAAGSGAGDRIRLLGSVAPEQLAELFAAADAVALASAREGLANVWVEALASGTPLVITDAGGARELVVSPVQGRIVERSATAIAQGLVEVFAMRSDRHQVRATVADYSWDRNGAALHRHLAGLVERAQAIG